MVVCGDGGVVVMVVLVQRTLLMFVLEDEIRIQIEEGKVWCCGGSGGGGGGGGVAALAPPCSVVPRPYTIMNTWKTSTALLECV